MYKCICHPCIRDNLLSVIYVQCTVCGIWKFIEGNLSNILQHTAQFKIHPVAVKYDSLTQFVKYQNIILINFAEYHLFIANLAYMYVWLGTGLVEGDNPHNFAQNYCFHEATHKHLPLVNVAFFPRIN